MANKLLNFIQVQNKTLLDSRLLGYNVVSLGKWLPVFWKNTSPSSGRKTEVLWEKTVLLPLGLPQVSRGLAWNQTRDSHVRHWWLMPKSRQGLQNSLELLCKGNPIYKHILTYHLFFSFLMSNSNNQILQLRHFHHIFLYTRHYAHLFWVQEPLLWYLLEFGR
jgi:hypothetical protein